MQLFGSQGIPFIAIALANAGIRTLYVTEKMNKPRGIFCGQGRCGSCRMIVDGVPDVKTCSTPVTTMHDGIIYTGVPNKEELKNAPGIPAADKIKPGGTAFIECLQTIACNPCEANCPTGAISIGAQISNRPVLDTNKCVGCGTCVSKCPGLAITVIACNRASSTTVLSLPYEYFPLPKAGDTVAAVDREGRFVCNARVLQVKPMSAHQSTSVVKIEFPEEFTFKVKSINTFHWRSKNG